MYDRHIFVCTNVKSEGKISCGPRGGEQICEQLKMALKRDPVLSTESLRVNKSGCLGPCEDGPNMVIYPTATAYSGVSPADVPALVQSLRDHVPLVRLQRKPAGG